MKWWKIVGILLLICVIVWLGYYITRPAPGTQIPNLGREHVSKEQVAQTQYSSNPPTSGPHVETWAKPGIYTTPLEEGELIHSLEHGYIIVHYNCSAGSTVAEATASAFAETEECNELVKSLEEVVKGKGLKKLIMVPRPNLDSYVAVTAWEHLDKFNTVDRERIEKFIDYYRDHGPEQTME